MVDSDGVTVAIIDYGLGNLFSVKNACEYAGVRGTITSEAQEVLKADAVILPGVGAFGDAIQALDSLDLSGPIKDVAMSGKPLLGICLGMQLLMTESYEFGRHPGLGIIEGPVEPLRGALGPYSSSSGVSPTELKVPLIGWTHIFMAKEEVSRAAGEEPREDPWSGSLLEGLSDGEFMYFVHSFYVKPEDSRSVLSTSRHGNLEFCSSFRYRNIFGCQFHPERSGHGGLQIYRNLARLLKNETGSEWAEHA